MTLGKSAASIILQGFRISPSSSRDFVNINFFYNRKAYEVGLQHRFGSKLKTELRLSRTEISQTKAYAYALHDRLYSEYTLAEAKLSFLWRPFSRFLRTPEENVLLERNYPEITGEINKSFSGDA